jgi:sec-independent protein translocase protein TatC
MDTEKDTLENDAGEQQETSSAKRPGRKKTEMHFLDHLEELRWRIVKGLAGIVVAAIVCAIFANWLVEDVLLAPVLKVSPSLALINLKPYGKVLVYMHVILLGGFILSIPNILYQFWKFIEPGLYPHERRYIFAIVLFSSLCFFLGVAFSYFIMLPITLQFFAGFGTTAIENTIAINEYMSFVLRLMLASGLVFEMPMVSFFLARLGILTPAFMRHYRRHAYTVLLIIAALITPADVVSMMILAVPLLLLYEISIFIARVAMRKRQLAQDAPW